MPKHKRKVSESPIPMEISSPIDLKTDKTYFFYDLNPLELEEDLGFGRLTLKTEEILDKPEKIIKNKTVSKKKVKKRTLPPSFLKHKNNKKKNSKKNNEQNSKRQTKRRKKISKPKK